MKNVRSGQTLLELIIAIGVIMVSTLSATTLIVSTINAGQVSQTKVEAANFSREGVELLRGIRDSNWLKRDQNVTDISTGNVYSWNTGLGAGNYVATFNGTAWNLVTYQSIDAVNLIGQPNGQSYFTQNCSANCTETRYHRKLTIIPTAETLLGVSRTYLSVISVVWWGSSPADPKTSYTAYERLYDWK